MNHLESVLRVTLCRQSTGSSEALRLQLRVRHLALAWIMHEGRKNGNGDGVWDRVWVEFRVEACVGTGHTSWQASEPGFYKLTNDDSWWETGGCPPPIPAPIPPQLAALIGRPAMTMMRQQYRVVSQAPQPQAASHQPQVENKTRPNLSTCWATRWLWQPQLLPVLGINVSLRGCATTLPLLCEIWWAVASLLFISPPIRDASIFSFSRFVSLLILARCAVSKIMEICKNQRWQLAENVFN